MKKIDNIKIFGINSKALTELKERVSEKVPVRHYILYGSYSRGEYDNESDIDLLVLTERPISNKERNSISDVVFEVNLLYNTNFSTTTAEINEWENGILSVLPFYDQKQ